jgi:hypothetical protein
MPLKCITNGALQCQVTSKRSKIRCKNAAAYGCRSCVVHGAHLSRNVLRGECHPNFKNGNESKSSRAQRSRKQAELRYLIDLGNHQGLFRKKFSVVGRPPNGYIKLNLDDPENIKLVLKKLSTGIFN